MTTQALDVASAFYALDRLEKGRLGEDRVWEEANCGQARFFILYRRSREFVPGLKDIKAEATASGVIPPLTISIKTTLDKWIKWQGGIAEKTDIYVSERRKSYPGFELKGFQVLKVEGYKDPLVILYTQTADQVWLMMHPEIGGLDLVETAFDLLEKRLKAVPWREHYDGVVVPKIDFALNPDISFLVGARTRTKDDLPAEITRASQDFKFRMNEEGARAVVVTTMEVVIMAAITHRPVLVFNKPFIGFFVQGGLAMKDMVPLPLAPFWADYDSWKEPAGSLAEL